MPYRRGQSSLPKQKMDMERRSSVHQRFARLDVTRDDRDLPRDFKRRRDVVYHRRLLRDQRLKV